MSMTSCSTPSTTRASAPKTSSSSRTPPVHGYPPPPAPPPTAPWETYTYTRVFQPRLLGFRGPIHDPASVTSYSPETGLSHTVWTLPGGAERYIDPACIVVSIAGQLDAADHSLAYGVFFGPGSPRNRAGRIPSRKDERTRIRLHAELHAAAAALELVRAAVDERADALRNVVVVTDSRRVLHGVSSCVVTWKQNQWMRAAGRKPVPNAKTWKKIVGAVEELEARGVGVRFWNVSEDVNRDAAWLSAQAAARRSPLAARRGAADGCGDLAVAFPGVGYVPQPGLALMSPASTTSTYSASSFGECYGVDSSPFGPPYEGVGSPLWWPNW